MPRYLLQRSVGPGGSEIVEIEASGILEASRIVGWKLSEGQGLWLTNC